MEKTVHTERDIYEEISENGCSRISCDTGKRINSIRCPFYNCKRGCTLVDLISDEYAKTAKEAANEKLEEIKKAEFIENLT